VINTCHDTQHGRHRESCGLAARIPNFALR
jgi:hypothetical protein